MPGTAPITQDEMIAALATQTAALIAVMNAHTAEIIASDVSSADTVALAQLTAAHLLMVETAAVNAHHVISPIPLIVPQIAKNKNADYFETVVDS